MTAPTDADLADWATCDEHELAHPIGEACPKCAPTETPSLDCEMCEGQPPPVLEGVVQHCEGCSEPPSLTTGQAREYARHWTQVRHMPDEARRLTLTDPEREQLFAWVRARMVEMCSLGGPAWTAGGYERNTAAGLLALELAIEGQSASAIIDAADGWPS